MTRTIVYDIPSSAPFPFPLTIKGFLKHKGYSVQNAKRLKQDPQGILLNDIPAHLNTVLSPGDRLTICIREEDSSKNILPVPLPLDILYEDEDLLVLNKPAGVPIHPSQNNHDNTLANALASYFHECGKAFVFRCINRLDRDTSGLTLVAKHYVSAGILGQAISDKTNDAHPIKREYLAIVHGNITPSHGIIAVPLGRKPGSIIERCVDFDNGERAVTHYQVLESWDRYSLVSLWLETGRTHQIRIHMKYLGHPLVGDYLYGTSTQKQDPIDRQALHSHSLSFIHPITGAAMDFSVPMPPDMQALSGSSMESTPSVML